MLFDYEFADIRIVYVLTNRINGKKYVGSSHHPYYRMKRHLYMLKRNKHSCKPMQEDYNKYGDCFDLSFVDLVTTFRGESEEYKWMKKLKTYDERYGYNCTDTAMNRVRREHGLSYRTSPLRGRKRVLIEEAS